MKFLFNSQCNPHIQFFIRHLFIFQPHNTIRKVFFDKLYTDNNMNDNNNKNQTTVKFHKVSILKFISEINIHGICLF